MDTRDTLESTIHGHVGRGQFCRTDIVVSTNRFCRALAHSWVSSSGVRARSLETFGVPFDAPIAGPMWPILTDSFSSDVDCRIVLSGHLDSHIVHAFGVVSDIGRYLGAHTVEQVFLIVVDGVGREQ